MTRAWNGNSRSSLVDSTSLLHGSSRDWSKPIGPPAATLFVHWSNVSRLTKNAFVSSSASILLQWLHSFLRKKMPKVCNIVGGVVSPILANIYLHELDEYVEQLQKELEKGELRRPNPEYRRLQKRRQYLAKIGKIDTGGYRELGVQMRKFPSLVTHAPNFVRVKYAR